jgi:hypothetical protein
MIAIWTWLKSKPPQPLAPSEERRRAPRYRCAFPAAVRLVSLTDTVLMSARAWDVSAGGVGLVCATPLPPDRFVAIAPVPVAAGALLVLRARVVRCTRLEDGRWLVGCSLLEGLNEEQLQALA